MAQEGSTRSVPGSIPAGSDSGCGCTTPSPTGRSARPRSTRSSPTAGGRPARRGGRQPGACLGIPGITAHRAVFADGPVDGATVLVHGALGGVGSLAAQLARGRRNGDQHRTAHRRPRPAHRTGRRPRRRPRHRGPRAAIREHAPSGVDRIIEVAFSDNVDLDAAVAANDAVIAAYATRTDRPDFPFWPCCSPTSPSDSSAATTSPSRPGSRPPPISPTPPAPAT